MKKLVFILTLVTFSFVSNAQCEEDYAIYRNEYKQKNYDEALKSWRKVYNNCPEFNQNTFSNGPKLYHHRIKTDKENKFLYLDTLMMIYDARIQYFQRREYVLGKKGVDLLKYDENRVSEAYEMLKGSKIGEKGGCFWSEIV